MILSDSAALLATFDGSPTLTVLEEAVSTNDDLRAASAGVPSFTAVVTGSQTGGRGRLGRPWVAPAGQALALSVLVRPRDAHGVPLPLHSFGWFPIIAGVAMTASVRALLPGAEVSVKWPNDVLIGRTPLGRKVCGILTEVIAGDAEAADPALIIGAGLNLAIPASALPTLTSTSLLIEGALPTGDRLADAACAAYLAELERLCSAFTRAGGDPRASGIRSLALENLGTIGHRVKVTVPAGPSLVGEAVDLDDAGRIVVRIEGERTLQTVAAGDVEHLRYE